jgi:hypothetical protein
MSKAGVPQIPQIASPQINRLKYFFIDLLTFRKRGNLQIYDLPTIYFAIYRPAICELGHQGNMRICDLWINHYKFADLRFEDYHTSEFCGLAIWPQEFVDLRFAG